MLYYRSPHHDAGREAAVRDLRHDETVIKNKYIGHGIYVTIYWTSDGCDGLVDFEVTLVRRTSDIISLFRSLHHEPVTLALGLAHLVSDQRRPMLVL